MKTLHLVIIAILVIGISFSTICHAYADNQDPEMNLLSHESPVKQFKSGSTVTEVKCTANYVLTIKSEDGSPACVKQSTVKILTERGWAKFESAQSNQHGNTVANQ
jgi:hypothetical protein